MIYLLNERNKEEHIKEMNEAGFDDSIVSFGIRLIEQRDTIAFCSRFTGKIYIVNLTSQKPFSFEISRIGNPQNDFIDYVMSVINHKFIHKILNEIGVYSGIIDEYDKRSIYLPERLPTISLKPISRNAGWRSG